MEQLIKIQEIKDGSKAVLASDLYSYLGYDKSQWKRWYQKNIINNSFAIEYKDWQGFDTVSNGNKSKDFILSFEFGKKISMLARTENGEKARNYFIECEKQLLKPKTQIELIIESAQLLKSIEEKQIKLEQRIESIENRPQINAPIEHFSILGYCHNIGKQVSHNEALVFGRKAAKVCKELGMVVGKISDARYGAVNTYPLDVLNGIINDLK